MGNADDMLAECKKHLGEMKLYTGEDESLPWCARFLKSCFEDIGMSPPDTWSAKGLYDWCEPVPDECVQSGDLVVFNFDGRMDTNWFDHIGIVLWFDHDADCYKTVEGNSGSDYSVGTYFYDNNDYPPKTYFCRPPYDNGRKRIMNEEDFDEIWCNNSFNAEPIDGKWDSTPGNILLHIMETCDKMLEELNKLSK